MPRVISVAGAEEIFYPRLRRLYDYWDDKRGARRMPCRKDIDPVELRDLLGFINLVDVLENPRDYRIRLMGTKTKPIVGSDITGKRYSEIDPKRKFRSEEHTSELQSLMRISYAVFCLKKTKKKQ